MASICKEVKNNQFKYNLETEIMLKDQGDV